jgi:hypothetical protein
MLRAYDYPCIWNGNLFITADGRSVCCNDQAVRNPFGSILEEDVEALMRHKETYRPNGVCGACDQRPQRMRGSVLALALNVGGRVRMAIGRRVAKGLDAPGAPYGERRLGHAASIQ